VKSQIEAETQKTWSACRPDDKFRRGWFGGKSRAAELVWSRLGDIGNYVEPFAGSLAVLLARPHEPRIETINDKMLADPDFYDAST
jgi:hypothetical protein